MKSRKGFVSNSSSTCFMIQNRTREHKTMKNFVKCVGQWAIQKFKEEYISSYDSKIHNYQTLLKCADLYDYSWHSYESILCHFGDEDGNPLGYIFDYILRYNDCPQKSFDWRIDHYDR